MNQPASTQSPGQKEPPARPWVEIFGSRALPEFLAQSRLSLAFSTYQTGKLFFVGTHSRQLSVFERTFDRAMGLFGNSQTIWLGTRYQLWRFENMLPAGQVHEERDRLFVPRVGYTTGDIDMHDVVVERTGRVVFTATACSCLATLSESRSFRPLWQPNFISELSTEDRCHLNGIALRDGQVRYVTVVARTDVVDGWRSRRIDGGCVIDVVTNAVVADGLSMPHSPRWYWDQLWVLNSGRGEFGRVDLKTGRFEPIAFCPGYLRGLAFAGEHAIVSLSQPRQEKSFTGLPLDAELSRRNSDAQCGLQIIDLRTGSIAHWLRVEGEVSEIYDVIALVDVVRPMALGFKTDEISRLLVADSFGSLLIAHDY